MSVRVRRRVVLVALAAVAAGLVVPSMMRGDTAPVPGQPGTPMVTSGFRHLSVAWNPPSDPLPGFLPSQLVYYEVWEVRAGGPVEVGTSGFTHFDVSGLATGYAASYEVRAVYGDTRSPGPMSSVSNTAATSTRVLVYGNRWSNLAPYAQSVAPAGAAVKVASPFVVPAIDDISVGFDQRWMAVESESVSVADQRIGVIPTDASSAGQTISDATYPFDTDPAVAPDSSAVVYTADDTFGGPHTVLRRWIKSSGVITTVAGGADVTQAAYTPDGAAVIAVSGGQLVRLDLATGTATAVAGGQAATEPAVAADERVRLSV